jgi:AcrR family transcriptional regulator
MSYERDFATAPKGTPKGVADRGYHHGDLRNGLLQAARTILEEESLAALTLRAVARKAGVSHAAPYRHFSSHEALLVELSLEGFDELRLAIAEAARAASPTRSPPSAPPICVSWPSVPPWRD